MASIAEKVNRGKELDAQEKKAWQKFVDAVRDYIAKKLNSGRVKKILAKDNLTEKDIAKMVLASYVKMKEPLRYICF